MRCMLGEILVGVLAGGVVVGVIIAAIIRKKKGKCSCACSDCQHCSGCSSCKTDSKTK